MLSIRSSSRRAVVNMSLEVCDILVVLCTLMPWLAVNPRVRGTQTDFVHLVLLHIGAIPSLLYYECLTHTVALPNDISTSLGRAPVVHPSFDMDFCLPWEESFLFPFCFPDALEHGPSLYLIYVKASTAYNCTSVCFYTASSNICLDLSSHRVTGNPLRNPLRKFKLFKHETFWRKNTSVQWSNTFQDPQGDQIVGAPK